MVVDGKTVLIAANPKSGAASSAELVQRLKCRLDELGFPCEIISNLEQLQARTTQLHASGAIRCVVSAGGDGTVSAIANLIPPEVPVLIFPLGTENLLAKHLGLSRDVESAAAVVQANVQTVMDVGTANGKLFLVMLSVGFDALVVQRMAAIRRGHINRWSYTRPILSAMSQYSFPRLKYRTCGSLTESEDGSSGAPAWLFVFNVPRYAANLQFCPQADPSDGLLDLCTFQQRGLTSGLGYLSQLWLNRHQKLSGFEHKKVESIEIDADPAAGDVPFQIDGDFGGILPLKIEVVPERLRLLFAP